MIHTSRRKFISGAAALLAAPSIFHVRPALASIRRSGNRVYYMTPLYVLDTITPEAGVKSADLASPNGTYRQRLNLSNLRGMRLIPPEAESVTLWCQLFRDYAGSVGETDATMGLSIGSETLKSFATAACTPVGVGARCVSPSSIVESLGTDIEFPNIVDADGANACIDWSIGGNTVLKCAAMIQLMSFTVPSSYTLPAVWPARNASSDALAMYFGSDGFADSSSASRTITAHNCSIQSGSTTRWANPQSSPDALMYQDTGGGAIFNGSSSYLNFDGHDITLSGDFTIQVVMSGSTNALQGGCQQRILCLGGAGSPAIAIDPSGGGAMLINEDTSALAIGGNSIVTGYKTSVEWSRRAGVNTFRVNGQQDGQPFTNNTAWVIGSSAQIGRHYSGVGYFNGKIHLVKVTNGIAV